MNLWLVVPGIVLILVSSIPFLFFEYERPPVNEQYVTIRAILLVIGFLVGVALLLEGLTGFTTG